jgi:hypothetical protein
MDFIEFMGCFPVREFFYRQCLCHRLCSPLQRSVGIEFAPNHACRELESAVMHRSMQIKTLDANEGDVH